MTLALVIEDREKYDIEDERSMLIVDSSVWIDYYEGRDNPHTTWLDRHIRIKRVGLTDQILCEVLQGVRLDCVFAERSKQLSRFAIFNTGGGELAILSAKNYRHLRSSGTTIRTAVDCLIATFCIVHGSYPAASRPRLRSFRTAPRAQRTPSLFAMSGYIRLTASTSG